MTRGLSDVLAINLSVSISKIWFRTLALTANAVPPNNVNKTNSTGGKPYIETTIDGTDVISNSSTILNLESFK